MRDSTRITSGLKRGYRRIKLALRHPGKAMTYLMLGSKRYNQLESFSWFFNSATLGSKRYNQLESFPWFFNSETLGLQAEINEMNMKPANLLEARMVEPTDIQKHIATLHMLTIELDLKTILELGVRYGESTIVLLLAAKEVGGHVYSIDIDPCLEAKRRIKEYGLEEDWTFFESNDIDVDWKRPIDHLFIDSSHQFDHTLMELRKYEPFVKRGGLITTHDIVFRPDILRAIEVYIKDRNDLKLYKYFHNNGLAVIFKK